MAKTIDNLPTEDYNKYAQSQQQLEQSKQEQDLPSIHLPSTQIDTLISSPSYLEEIVGASNVQITWASFTPFDFSIPINPFSDALVSFLTPSEKIERLIERLKTSLPTGSSADTGETHEKKVQEQNILISLLQLIDRLDKVWVDIKSSRLQYQKG